MKVRTVREFEEGDIIVNTMYNWVAVRVAGTDIWKHSNGEDLKIKSYFSDDEVNKMLDGGIWVYVGNRVELSGE